MPYANLHGVRIVYAGHAPHISHAEEHIDVVSAFCEPVDAAQTGRR
ncbi:MAG: hypothetical protein KF883_03160 [Thermomicrobiales bacterium]|nr:hypothetical protein [Thermomicrobiales bacterium]